LSTDVFTSALSALNASTVWTVPNVNNKTFSLQFKILEPCSGSWIISQFSFYVINVSTFSIKFADYSARETIDPKTNRYRIKGMWATNQIDVFITSHRDPVAFYNTTIAACCNSVTVLATTTTSSQITPATCENAIVITEKSKVRAEAVLLVTDPMMGQQVYQAQSVWRSAKGWTVPVVSRFTLRVRILEPCSGSWIISGLSFYYDNVVDFSVKIAGQVMHQLPQLGQIQYSVNGNWMTNEIQCDVLDFDGHVYIYGLTIEACCSKSHY